MADDGATRTRRWKLHRAGDHHECKPGCGGLRGPVVLPVPPAGDGSGLDPVASMRRLAVRLEAFHELDPGNAMVARVLQQVLLSLMSPAAGAAAAPDEVDQIRREWEAGGIGV